MKRLVCVLILLIVLLSGKGFAQKYSALEMQDSSFVTFFDEYVQTNQPGKHLKGVPVLFVTSHSLNKVEVVITMFSLLSQVVDNYPDNYTYIHNRLVVIYDGTQQIFSLNPSWLAELRRLVEADLCNNVTDELRVKNAGKKEEVAVSPCAFKHDPFEWTLTFTKGKLVKRERFVGDLYK